MGAKLVKNESAIELDNNVNVNKEKDIKKFVDDINKMFDFPENKE